MADLVELERPESVHSAEEPREPIAIEDVETDVSEKKVFMADDPETMFGITLPKLDQETEAEGYYQWHIKTYRDLEERIEGPVFEVGEHKWKILLFPYGNKSASATDHLSAYVDYVRTPDTPSENRHACAVFSIVAHNVNDPSVYHSQHARHRFSPQENDWGFTRFVHLRSAFSENWEDKDRPLVENDEVVISAYIRIFKDPTGVLWHNFSDYDSKKETGYVGLKNQGATCYMNSLLQSLYYTNYFRKAVYQIPTENDDPHNSITLALQRIFYQLQTADDAVGTLDLTKSFGWDSMDAFMQHDVQEFNRVLQDNLEGKMKNTRADGALNKLFVGKMKSYIKCVDVDYESSRTEDFWDIQLNVKGMKNLQDSFKDYIQVETLDGDNKYFAEGFGLQDARKGVIFQSFPPVLHLQLKRFEYDMMRDAMVKINDRHEFPLEINLEPYLAEDADRSQPHIYKLHGVLVHSGDLHGGHYYALIKPEKESGWFKYDDDRVVRATLKEVLEENFGGEAPPTTNGFGVRAPQFQKANNLRRFMNAYMLVYVRESMIDEVLAPISEDDTPPHIKEQLEKERIELERRRKEMEERHLYMYARVVHTNQYKNHQGFDMGRLEATFPGDEVPADEPITMRILKSMTFRDFREQIATENGVAPGLVRFWMMVYRQNKTSRPDVPLPAAAEDMTMDQVREKYFQHRTPDVKFFMEVADPSFVVDGVALWPNEQNDGNMLVFLKEFDTEAQTLKGAWYTYVNRMDKVGDIATAIVSKKGWPSNTQVKLFEEIKPGMIEPIKPKQTYHQAEIQDGDIICFQRTLPEKQLADIQQSGGYISATEYYDFMVNRVRVTFKPMNIDDTQQEFYLDLSRKNPYFLVASKVAEHLGVDATHVRFTTSNSQTGQPKSTVKQGPGVTLQNMLQPYFVQNPSTQLFYEVLDVSLTELESKKSLKFHWLSEGVTKEELVEILVIKNGCLQDAVPLLAEKLKLSEDQASRLRVYQVHNNKIYKTVELTYPVASVPDYISLYVEEMPEEEIHIQPNDRKIPVFSFSKEPSRPHGHPFTFVIKQGETFKETKARLLKRTGFKEKEFGKIKFAVVKQASFSKPTYLEDDDVLSQVADEQDDVLGMDHADKTGRTRFSAFERAFQIKG
ncbi:ubiquitin-specific protease ubp15 [Saitoella coloradoensis]